MKSRGVVFRLALPYLRPLALFRGHLCKAQAVGFLLFCSSLGELAQYVGHLPEIRWVTFRFLVPYWRRLVKYMGHPYDIQGVRFPLCAFCSAIYLNPATFGVTEPTLLSKNRVTLWCHPAAKLHCVVIPKTHSNYPDVQFSGVNNCILYLFSG